MTSRTGRRAVVLRYAGKKEWAEVFYRMLKFYIENRERGGSADTSEAGGGEVYGSNA